VSRLSVLKQTSVNVSIGTKSQKCFYAPMGYMPVYDEATDVRDVGMLIADDDGKIYRVWWNEDRKSQWNREK